MSFASMISEGLGATMSNFISIATANQRASLQRKKYETQARLNEYNRQVQENQAIAERQNAKAARDAAHTQKEQMHRKDQSLRESQLAMMAKSGITMAGTPLLVAQDQLAEMKLKENDIIYKGAEESRQHENRAAFFDSKAKISQYYADVARATGKYKSDMIGFQKKLTIAKMFYDPGNVTSFGEVDNPQQFQHLSSSSVSSAFSGMQTQSKAKSFNYDSGGMNSGPMFSTGSSSPSLQKKSYMSVGSYN